VLALQRAEFPISISLSTQRVEGQGETRLPKSFSWFELGLQ
jgi:hypothetical protein